MFFDRLLIALGLKKPQAKTTAQSRFVAGQTSIPRQGAMRPYRPSASMLPRKAATLDRNTFGDNRQLDVMWPTVGAELDRSDKEERSSSSDRFTSGGGGEFGGGGATSAWKDNTDTKDDSCSVQETTSCESTATTTD